MSELQRAVDDFLTLDRIAVVGVSRDSRQPANLIYRKLRDEGYAVFAVNPNAERVEGDPCYRHVRSIPGGVRGAVIVTKPEIAASVVDDCVAAGVEQVWFHRSFGAGSVSKEAVERCRQNGLKAIAGACPMMFCDPVDPGHKCMRWILRWTGGLPKPAETAPH
jgi:predicted CoA-binding protein